jgi:hypothetical protein
MNKFKEYINKASEKTGFKPEDIVAFIFSIVITTFFFIDTTYLHNHAVVALWIFIAVVITIFVSWLLMKAVATVLSSLFLLSAEISLLVFLAQSYCDVVKVPSQSDNALRSLVGFGIFYIAYKFFQYLGKALKTRLSDLPEKKTKGKFLIIGLFLIFTGSFVWTVFQVTDPIILNLCIYKR